MLVKTAMNNGINQQRKAGCRTWVRTRKALNPFGTKNLVFQVKLIFSDLRTTFKILCMAELLMGRRSCTGRRWLDQTEGTLKYFFLQMSKTYWVEIPTHVAELVSPK